MAAGSAQVTARVAAWMLSGRKGPKPECNYVGCVGEDDHGRKMAQSCTAGGVAAEYLHDGERRRPTPTLPRVPECRT